MLPRRSWFCNWPIGKTEKALLSILASFQYWDELKIWKKEI